MGEDQEPYPVWVERLIAEAALYAPHARLTIDEREVEFIIGNHATYTRWDKDLGVEFHIDMETEKLVGVSWPRSSMEHDRLAVHYNGLIKINDGFLKSEIGE